MREDVERPDVEPEVIALAATDPANVYGAAVAWPAPTEGGKLRIGGSLPACRAPCAVPGRGAHRRPIGM